MRDVANIEAVAALCPDMMGFIFYGKSPRYAGGLSPEIVKSLPTAITPVGLFVNSPTAEIESICDRYGISTIQLHGDESPRECMELKSRGYNIVKALAIDETTPQEQLRAYDGAADLLVLDSRSASRGGSGLKFDWHLLGNLPISTPFLLSGGIAPDDAPLINRLEYAAMAGVDINSRFETSPGVKDAALIREFINQLR